MGMYRGVYRDLLVNYKLLGQSYMMNKLTFRNKEVGRRGELVRCKWRTSVEMGSEWKRSRYSINI